MKVVRVTICSLVAVTAFGAKAFSASTPAPIPPLLGTLNGPAYLITLDRQTGLGTRIGSFAHRGGAMTALAYDGIHDVLYGSAVTFSDVPIFYTINPTTGRATQVGSDGALGFFAAGMAHDSLRDVLYAVGGNRFNQKSLFTVDRATGVGTLLGQVQNITRSIQDLSFDRGNDVLYGLEEVGRGARVVRINPTTLETTAVTDAFGLDELSWGGLAFDPATRSLFVTANFYMYRVDPLTGQAVTVGLTYSPELHSIGALTVMARVPEPSILGMAMIATGVGAALLRRR